MPNPSLVTFTSNVMRLRLSASATFLAFALLVQALSGCASPPSNTDFVIVEPERYVPPPAAPIPNFAFGWLPAEAANADAFRVKVGNRQYLELMKRVGPENIKAELALFAEKEVVARNFCPSRVARTKRPQVVGPRSGEYVWVMVECVGR